MLFMPETPVYLYKMGRGDKADEVLLKLYKPAYIEDKKRELQTEVDNIKLESRDPILMRTKQLFTVYGKCILIGGGLQFWQQFCGINTVMYFGPDIL
jgi:hypothetical protein